MSIATSAIMVVVTSTMTLIFSASTGPAATSIPAGTGPSRSSSFCRFCERFVFQALTYAGPGLPLQRRREVAVDLAIHGLQLALEVVAERSDHVPAAAQLVLVDVGPLESEFLHHPDEFIRQHHSHGATSLRRPYSTAAEALDGENSPSRGPGVSRLPPRGSGARA
ncbi:hypothetical protein [Microbacterium aurum]|uniref:hypothetical protein n=1 Tax=Microbacterium aurum TaxID=36805 RepID=UPI0018DCF185|nr:hypothetical protein [Microbacterium aurum]MBM7829113.1 hypothetical protein [Microbacterium aurum]